MSISAQRLFSAVDATWPAAAMISKSPWTLRAGEGGGKRVSAATLEGEFDQTAIGIAEAEMIRLDQKPLFMLRDGDAALDAALAALGYRIVDPVTVLTCPIQALTGVPVPPVTAFTIWEPLAIMCEIWARGGIGPERLDVMRRANVKTAVLARWNQKPAGVGFVALDREIAMVHAVEVEPEQRRQGVAQWIMRQAAFWAADKGAQTMAALCTKANEPALRLYSGLGFEAVAEYHYRLKTNDGDVKNG